MNCLRALLFFSCWSTIFLRLQAIGVNYGLNGDNLPSPANVISLLKSRNISKIRLFEPNQAVLQALQGSGVSVIIGTRNEDLQALATDITAATGWVATNVIPFASSIYVTCISAGNEVMLGELAQYVPGAMQNLDSALLAANLNIPVSTAVTMSVLSVSHPPSLGVFSPATSPIMTQVTNFLQTKGSPLLVNAYPYLARASFPADIPLDYALGEDTAAPDPDGALLYRGLLDAMIDAVHAALEKAGGPDVEVVVTETGWPSEGGPDASIENAERYNNNLVRHVGSGQGTPRRPGKAIEAYIFELFNEDLKPDGVERHWGLYYPDMTEVYHVDF